MILTLRVGPTELALDQTGVMNHLRISTNTNTRVWADVLRMSRGVVEELDGSSGMLGRALITQEWSAWLDCWSPKIELPLPPTQSVEAILYLDTSGSWQTLDPESYRFIDGGNNKSSIVPAYGVNWPAHQPVPACIEIRFTAGFGDDPEDIPADITNAMLELLALRLSVKDGIMGEGERLLPSLPGVQALDRWRVWL